jgi:hypothetical protein
MRGDKIEYSRRIFMSGIGVFIADKEVFIDHVGK